MARFDLDNYVDVKDRILDFWKDYPEGSIITDMIYFEAETGRAIFQAKVFRSPEEFEKGISTSGLAEETEGKSTVNKTSFIENGETSAIGRALANMGYGTEANRPSRNEMMKVARREQEHEEIVEFIKTYGETIPDDLKVKIDTEDVLLKDYIRLHWSDIKERYPIAKRVVDLVETSVGKRLQN